MMIKTLMQQLYDGEIYPSEEINPQDPEYRKNTHKIDEEKAYFRNILSKEEQERFEKLYNMHEDNSLIYGFENFLSGFKLGVGLMVEALIGD